MHHSIWKILFVLGADEYLERLEGKLESAYSFMLKYSKMTVITCYHHHFFGIRNIFTKWKRKLKQIFSQSSNCKFLPYLLYFISKLEIVVCKRNHYMIVGCFSRHRFASKPTTNLKGIRALMRQVVHIIFNYTVN